MEDMLVKMLSTQLDLQTRFQKDGDPRILDPETRAQFMTWNFAACIKELGEAMDEVGWKPWATNRSINHEAFLKEMLDGWCFFMNMLLAGSGVESMDELAYLMLGHYMAKNEVNIRRQVEGYDGMTEKCPTCHRDLAETDPSWHCVHDGITFCSSGCRMTYDLNKEKHTDG